MSRVRTTSVALLMVVSCSLSTTSSASAAQAAPPPPVYTISNPKLLPIDVGAGLSTVTQGELEGSGYIIEVPPNWNHELVMWAHGWRGNGTVLTVQPPGYGMRQHLLQLGYAWAASSYDANGYDIESGVRSTRELAGLFRQLVERPRRTYLAGESMGGHVTARSIEQYPAFYDGALPLCGVVGDVELFDFFTDFTFVAQDLADIPAYPIPANYASTIVPQLQAKLGTNGIDPPTFGPLTNPLGLQLRDIVIQQSGGPRPGAEAAFGYWNDFLFTLPSADTGGLLSFNPGRVGTNVGTTYTPSTPQPVNDTVARVGPVDPRSRDSRALGPIARVEGQLRVPVLTLHDLGDLFVPFSMEQYYARDVAANGRSDLLVQRAIRAVGHCEFSNAEVQTAFDDLVTWVEDGVRPAGDDVLTAATVADPTFGCQFSDRQARTPTRALFAPCPAS